jgi:hypothetical protein
MLTVEQIDLSSKPQVRRFLELPFRIYANTPQWAPPLARDAAEQLDRRRHPFYEHGDAAFFVAVREGRDVGRITHQQEVVGFLFAFPDITAALRRTRGKLAPFGWIDLLREMRRTEWVTVNAAGILPEFQGHGGNALLYAEMAHTLLDYQFHYAELTQVAETAVQMRRDLENVGVKPYKVHRVYQREL